MTIREYLGDWLTSQTPPPSPPSKLVYTMWAAYSYIPSFIKDQMFLWQLGFYLVDIKGDYTIKKQYTDGKTNAEIDELIGKDLTMLYIANEYMLNKLYQSTKLDYKPLENYNMEESGTDKHTGTDTDTTNYGSSTRTDNVGTRTTTGSDTIGNQQTTSTDRVSPDELSNFINRSQQTIDSGSHTDSMQRTTQGTIDTTTLSEHSDINTFKHGHSISHNLKRSGNIGVTTSQQMLMSEREVADFSIYRVLADLIVHQICDLVFS